MSYERLEFKSRLKIKNKMLLKIWNIEENTQTFRGTLIFYIIIVRE